MKTSHSLKQLKQLYMLKKPQIRSRIREFEQNWQTQDDETIFDELSFCLLTPQSKAKYCWDAIETLKAKKLLLSGSAKEISGMLSCVRFHNKKAEYLVCARALFMKNRKIAIKQTLGRFADINACREWLVKNIRGIGYKEASHFLRNIGLGTNIAILDRHILKNLMLLGVIQTIPVSLSEKKYLDIEKAMSAFAKRIGIPMSHLDLLLWCKETGDIFK